MKKEFKSNMRKKKTEGKKKKKSENKRQLLKLSFVLSSHKICEQICSLLSACTFHNSRLLKTFEVYLSALSGKQQWMPY